MRNTIGSNYKRFRQNVLRLLPLIIVALTLLISGCNKKDHSIDNLKMLEGGKIFAVPSGTVADQMVLKKFPDAKILYFNSVMDCALAVKDGKADASSYDLPVLKNIAAKVSGLKVLDELIMEDSYGFAVQLKNTELKKTMDEVLHEIKADGKYKEMSKRWFPAQGNPGPMPEIKYDENAGVLRFGTAAVTEPMSYVDGNQNVVGFDIEYAAYIAKKLGKKLEIVNMEFGAMLPALISGKVDMVGAGLSITEERAKSVLFSESYYPSGIAVIVKDNAIEEKAKIESTCKLKTLDDVTGKKVGVLLGSIHETYAMENLPDTKILQFQNVSDLGTALKKGKVDVAIYDHMCLKPFLSENPDVDILVPNVHYFPIAAPFKKGNTVLRTKFNKFLAEIISNGTYDEMSKRWIENDVYEMPEIDFSNAQSDLRVGIVSDLGMTFSFVKDGKVVGLEIELAMRFAEYMGLKYVPVDMQFGSIISSLSTSKIDLAICSMMITEEREKQVDFSDPYYESGISIIARKNNIVKGTPKYTKLEDIADKTIGIYSGTVHDKFIAENYPKAKIKRFDLSADMVLSLRTGKIDVAMFDMAATKVIINKNPDLGVLTNDVMDMPLGIGFNKKNAALRDEFNRFLNEIKGNGKLDEMHKRWFEDDPEKTVMPKLDYQSGNKKLVAAVSVDDLPYVSFFNNTFVGFDVELIQRFAEWGHYNMQLVIIDFPALVTALSSGKVDLIADGIAITEERSKSIDFSDTYGLFKTSVIAKKADLPGGYNEAPVKKKSFIKSVSDSFYNNIILEDRYKLIFDGLKVTIIISILSALLGTLLGGLICFMRMSKKKVISLIAKLFISLIRGTPVLVLLMIIFYVVFSSVNINPVIVAILAFGINFGAYVSEMFRTSIESVDKGQHEAGIAGGFTKIQTFIFIIMPQALKQVLPVYKGEFISLVKMTSIVGYIAVQDITRASDIIRSRTFDAFFPLIMAAVIYLLLAWLLTWALDKIEISVDPKRKKIKRVEEVNI